MTDAIEAVRDEELWDEAVAREQEGKAHLMMSANSYTG